MFVKIADSKWQLYQVIKLYHPKRFPPEETRAMKEFKRYFRGDLDRKWTCAVGFEPNPRHEEGLRALQQSCASCGWKVQFFTRTAAWNTIGQSVLLETEGNLNSVSKLSLDAALDLEGLRTNDRTTAKDGFGLALFGFGRGSKTSLPEASQNGSLSTRSLAGTSVH